MNLQQLQLECIDVGFAPSDLKPAMVKRWLNQAEIELWNSHDWVFKRVSAATFNLTGGSRTPTMPADFGKATDLYDDKGCKLRYLSPDQWERDFLPDTSSARPCYYTVLNRQIYLGPTPDSAYSFKLSYRRRYAHLNGSGAVTAGVMSAADDSPLWDSEFHYILVPWALAIGGQLTYPTFFARGHVYSGADIFAETRDDALAAMVSELVPEQEGEIVIWGSGC